ncbi:MAG: hypothetical protein H7039_00065, partial [Bryobacteraceae bacterium]|nr:hypothetical protein [Bryobacteraceae bacterium]
MFRAGLLLFSAALSGSDLSGIWTGQLPARNGTLQDVSFKFIQTGNVLTGKMYGDYVSSPIS